jgi:hypothetical protein
MYLSPGFQRLYAQRRPIHLENLMANPFVTVKSYGAMLNQIAISTFAIALALVSLFRHLIPSIDKALSPFSFAIPLWNLNFPLATVAIAGAIAFTARIFKMHDIVSDLMGIRQRFDVSQILYPLALTSGAIVNGRKLRRIEEMRSDLMNETFYKYASSDATRTVIDRHLVEMALDMWRWYWACLEAIVLLIPSSALLLLYSPTKWGGGLATAVIVILFGMTFIRGHCADYARDEVAAITDDQTRRDQVAGEFNAL